MEEKKKSLRKKIEASTEMNRIMSEYFYELDHAAKTGEQKIAWCTSVGPAEILRALGFLVLTLLFKIAVSVKEEVRA